MTNGQRVIDKADDYIGLVERPPGSNDDSGGPLTRWQKAVGLYGLPSAQKPWCGTFLWNIFREAGVDDGGLCSPSTAVTCQRARDGGHIGAPRPGAMIVWCGTHVELLVAPGGAGAWHTIGGNTSDSVARRVRSLSGATIVVPPAIAADPADGEVTVWYLEDPGAKFKVLGPWRSRRSAEKAQKARGGEIKRRGKKALLPWVLRIGQPSVYGPWSTEARMKRAREVLERRLGRTLTVRKRTRALATVPGVAEDLGRTV